MSLKPFNNQEVTIGLPDPTLGTAAAMAADAAAIILDGSETANQGKRWENTTDGLVYDFRPVGGTWAYYLESNADASGNVPVSGLARNAIRLSTGTYNATEILGFRILVVGTGVLIFAPAGGGASIILTTAELTSMGINAFQDWPIACSSMSLGNTDMEVLLYIP